MTVREFKTIVSSFPEKYDNCEMFTKDEELCRYSCFDFSLKPKSSVEEEAWELRDTNMKKGEFYVLLKIKS